MENAAKFAGMVRARFAPPTMERDLEFVVEMVSERDRNIALAVLDDLRAFGCPHACTPPCPFHRRMRELAGKIASGDWKPGQ